MKFQESRNKTFFQADPTSPRLLRVGYERFIRGLAVVAIILPLLCLSLVCYILALLGAFLFGETALTWTMTMMTLPATLCDPARLSLEARLTAVVSHAGRVGRPVDTALVQSDPWSVPWSQHALRLCNVGHRGEL